MTMTDIKHTHYYQNGDTITTINWECKTILHDTFVNLLVNGMYLFKEVPVDMVDDIEVAAYNAGIELYGNPIIPKDVRSVPPSLDDTRYVIDNTSTFMC